MSVLLVIGSFFTQQHKINELQKELYIQENMTDQRYNYTETQIDISTLKEHKYIDIKIGGKEPPAIINNACPKLILILKAEFAPVKQLAIKSEIQSVKA